MFAKVYHAARMSARVVVYNLILLDLNILLLKSLWYATDMLCRWCGL